MIKIVLGSVAAFLLASSAGAADFTFGLTGNTGTNGTHANARTYSATNGAESLNVRVSGWSFTNTTVYDSFLGQYGTAGLGVTSGDENGSANTHVVDNQGRHEFLLFQFDKTVNFKSGTFTTYTIDGGKDSDAIIAWGNTKADWQSQLALDGKSVETLAGMFGGAVDSIGNADGGTRSLFLANRAANLWLVAATINNKDRIDGFKFGNLTVDSIAMPPLHNAVPEPASWAMMIGGFGMIGGAMRRRAGRSVAA